LLIFFNTLKDKGLQRHINKRVWALVTSLNLLVAILGGILLALAYQNGMFGMQAWQLKALDLAMLVLYFLPLFITIFVARGLNLSLEQDIYSFYFDFRRC